jgi:signal transduction histidine kinase
MTIRKRILKSNTWIVLLSLLALLIIGGSVIYFFEDTYVSTLSLKTKLEKNAYNVQVLLNQYNANNVTFTDADFNALNTKLGQYDYQLYITNTNNGILYSNVHHNQRETLEFLLPEISYTDKSEVYVWEDKTIIAIKLGTGSNIYDIISINSSDKDGIFKLSRGTFELLILSFLIVGVGSILMIMLISRFFTQRLVNQIMNPIKKLIDSAERIEQGNLDEPIIYNGEDEFEMVCGSFNKMQESLKAGMEKNAAYERARTDLVSGISHDLRTPLTSVKGYIKGVKDGIANTPEKMELYLDIAYKKACDMDVLLQKLFYFSKLETGNMPLNLIKTNFANFMKKYIKENDEFYKENYLDIELLIIGDHHDVRIDKEQISRVISNIIDNSIKYKTHEVIHITMEVAGYDDKEVLTITDDGEGVPEEKLPHLFEQFFRADEARSSRKVGSGLGLYISKYIIEQHGGSIAARNDAGLSIVICLPKRDEDKI